jgi:hypothetical protein
MAEDKKEQKFSLSKCIQSSAILQNWVSSDKEFQKMQQPELKQLEFTGQNYQAIKKSALRKYLVDDVYITAINLKKDLDNSLKDVAEAGKKTIAKTLDDAINDYERDLIKNIHVKKIRYYADEEQSEYSSIEGIASYSSKEGLFYYADNVKIDSVKKTLRDSIKPVERSIAKPFALPDSQDHHANLSSKNNAHQTTPPQDTSVKILEIQKLLKLAIENYQNNITDDPVAALQEIQALMGACSKAAEQFSPLISPTDKKSNQGSDSDVQTDDEIDATYRRKR